MRTIHSDFLGPFRTMKKITLSLLLMALAAPAFAGQCNSYGYQKKLHRLEVKAEIASRYGDRIKAQKLREKRQYLMSRCQLTHTLGGAAENYAPYQYH
uniref:hypothetical protein n=1 Tax=Burkholderia diffusa TaxID=488732 RepID=UPI001CC5DE64|nr:hypothetical protein [Burkholderia diffusa]